MLPTLLSPDTRSRTASVLIVILMLVSELAIAGAWFDLSEPVSHWLAAFSRAANLEPLGASGPELRVWLSEPMLGTIRGFVVTNARVIECETVSHVTGSTDTIDSARCKSSSISEHQRQALAFLKDLSTLDGKELDCGVRGGHDYFVEGSEAGRHFTFSAGNPDSCQDPGSLLVSKMLKTVFE
jgi:hypothetical protein